MANNKPHSEETKAKIRASMMKRFSNPQISTQTKINRIIENIIQFLDERNNIPYNINECITINKHWAVCDEETADNTKDISIYEFQKWICKKNS